MTSGKATQSIDLTDSAHARIKNVMDANKELGSKFRVYVTGGGCSGFNMVSNLIQKKHLMMMLLNLIIFLYCLIQCLTHIYLDQL